VQVVSASVLDCLDQPSLTEVAVAVVNEALVVRLVQEAKEEVAPEQKLVPVLVTAKQEQAVVAVAPEKELIK
jgi:hypothetical protein